MIQFGLHRRETCDRIIAELCFYDILSVQLVPIKVILTEIDFIAKYEYLNAIVFKSLHYNAAFFKDFHVCSSMLKDKQMFKYEGVW